MSSRSRKYHPNELTSMGIVQVLADLTVEKKVRLIRKWAAIGEPYVLRQGVEILHDHISRILSIPTYKRRNEDLKDLLKVLSLVFCAAVYDERNNVDHVGSAFNGYKRTELIGLIVKLRKKRFDFFRPKIPLHLFAHKHIIEEQDLAEDYMRWFYKSKKKSLNLVKFKFIFTAAKKAQMYCLSRKYYYGQEHVRITVNRSNIVQDARNEFYRLFGENDQNLKKNLQVNFVDELGYDGGGLTREFLQLVFNVLIEDLRRSTFMVDESNNLFWFDMCGEQNLMKLFLLGIIIGMALNHGVSLDAKFPFVFYKKLFCYEEEWEDLEGVDPVLYQTLLNIINSEYDNYDCYFNVPYRTAKRSPQNTPLFELKWNGKKIAVNKKNRYEFVRYYLYFILSVSTNDQFHAILFGFEKAVDIVIVKEWFSPEDLVVLFGEQTLDVFELQKGVTYEGYEESSPYIKDFWEIVQNFTNEQTKSLLQFVTGCERLPLGGISSLGMIISHQGYDSETLPFASTCIKTLYLPQYFKKEKLKQKLLLSLKYGVGFNNL